MRSTAECGTVRSVWHAVACVGMGEYMCVGGDVPVTLSKRGRNTQKLNYFREYTISPNIAPPISE
jgi:hypothetical protein